LCNIRPKVSFATNQGILKGKYHCTIDLLFDGLDKVCFANNKKMSVVIQLIPNQSNRRSMVQ
jgi:dUTPase